MSMFRMLKGDNIHLSAIFLATAVIIAFSTIFLRLASCDSPYIEPKHDFTFAVEDVSYLTMKQSKAQVKLKLPSLPVFSDQWQENPQVNVHWTITTRGGETYNGMSIGALTPPYDSFIFSIQEQLEEILSEYHVEEYFIWEYRVRIIREVTGMEIVVRHPETDEVLDTFKRRYAPDQRREETWSIN